MGFSKLTTHFQINTVDRSSRGNYKISSIGHHHTAGPSKLGALSQFLVGGRTVTPNYFIWEDEIWGIVDENYRAYTSASPIDDSRAITYEICNATAGPNWSFSKKTLDTVARLDADIVERYDIPLKEGLPGFWQHRNIYEWFGRGYATACAGPSFSTPAMISDVRDIIAAKNVEKEDEDMPARKVIKSTKATVLDGTKFRTLVINENNDVSLVTGPARVDVVVNLNVAGLPTSTVIAQEDGSTVISDPGVAQFRLVRTTVEKGKENVTRSEGTGLELTANGGKAFGQLHGIIDLGANERLRIEGIAFNAPEATVTWSASLRVQ